MLLHEAFPNPSPSASDSCPSPLVAAVAADLVNNHSHYHSYHGGDDDVSDDDDNDDDVAHDVRTQCPQCCLSHPPRPSSAVRAWNVVGMSLSPSSSPHSPSRPESTLSSLKTKCDRNVPCAQCVKRGCEAICPCKQLLFYLPHWWHRYLTLHALQLVSEHEVASEPHPIHSPLSLSSSYNLSLCVAVHRHSNVEVEQLQKNAASMTSRIRHLEHALAVSQAQLASNAQSGGYSLGRSGPLESGFKPAALSNVFNPATCTSSSVSPMSSSQVLFYLALMLNSVASIMVRSDAKQFSLSCQVNPRQLAL